MAHSEEQIKKHVRIYMMVFGSLAVLTLVTVAVGYLDMPIVPALIVGLSIASLKSWLVAGYFMHLVEEKKMIHAILLLTLVFFLFMVILFVAAFHGHEGGAIVA